MRARILWTVPALAAAAWAGSISPPSDIVLAGRSEWIVVGTLEQELPDRAPGGYLGTLAISEWIKGKAEAGTSAVTLLLAAKTERERFAADPGPKELGVLPEEIPVGSPRIFFLRRTDAAGVWDLADHHVGMRDVEERETIARTLAIAADPRGFIDDADAEVRGAAAWALGRDCAPDDLPAIERLLRDPEVAKTWGTRIGSHGPTASAAFFKAARRSAASQAPSSRAPRARGRR